MVFDIKTDQFEGPIDVLYKLIVSHDLDISELSISLIVDEFVAVVNAMEKFDLNQITEFTLIASILVELKSRKLLPTKENDLSDEDLLLYEERDLLLSRLVDCRTFREVSKNFLSMMEAAKSRYSRQAAKEDKFSNVLSDLLKDVTPRDLVFALTRIKRDNRILPQKVDLSHVSVSPRISIEEAFVSITRDLSNKKSITFKDATRQFDQPIDIVVFFLATLELFKIGIIELEQFTTFGELTLTLAKNVDETVSIDLSKFSLIDSYEG